MKDQVRCRCHSLEVEDPLAIYAKESVIVSARENTIREGRLEEDIVPHVKDFSSES
jgi:hypothetical protein